MQNAAHAYLQTQVGTTGRGEIIVMLYDGALRFLAQAKEKMEAGDVAGKGILISRALDIIHELDSSLNMEAGGDLAQNLHNLYFLCNTRLLQANLKLDTARLDSVVDILSGLRSAFAEIINTPEARAACAKMGAPKPATQQTTPPPSTGAVHTPTVNRSVAASMYGRQAGLRTASPLAGLSAPILPPNFPPQPAAAEPAAPPVPPVRTADSAPSPSSPAPSAPEAPAPAAAAPKSAAQASEPEKKQPDTPKKLQKPTLGKSGGFGGKKLVGYEKLLQKK